MGPIWKRSFYGVAQPNPRIDSVAELDPDPCPESNLEILCLRQLGRLELGKESQRPLNTWRETWEDHTDQFASVLVLLSIRTCKTAR